MCVGESAGVCMCERKCRHVYVGESADVCMREKVQVCMCRRK